MNDLTVTLIRILMPCLVAYIVAARFGGTAGLIVLSLAGIWTIVALAALIPTIRMMFETPADTTYLAPVETAMSPVGWFVVGAAAAPITAFLLAVAGFFLGRWQHNKRLGDVI
jgi:hypothetical protein